jgi:hypothetical protein
MADLFVDHPGVGDAHPPEVLRILVVEHDADATP